MKPSHSAALDSNLVSEVRGTCRVHRSHTWDEWLPLLLFSLAAVACREWLPPWVFMWVLAFAIFFGCKWLTLRRAVTRPACADSLAYLFTWPGMDADAFLSGHVEHIPTLVEWVNASVVTSLGGLLLWLAAGTRHDCSPFLAAWVGMTGGVMILHFGVFHLLSLGWRVAGRDAKPLMRDPLLATSLADFWGRRWNTAFHVLATDLVFRKLTRPFGVAWATVGAFLASGIIHDLVISLPARGGYGLPTGYFLLQGVGLLCERSGPGRSLGLGGGWRGRLFCILLAALPAPMLFHPPFLKNVILPMLHVLGGLGNIL